MFQRFYYFLAIKIVAGGKKTNSLDVGLPTLFGKRSNYFCFFLWRFPLLTNPKLKLSSNVRYYWHSYVNFFLHIYIASAIRKYKWLLDFRFKFRKIQWKLFEFCASNQTTFGYYFNPICHGAQIESFLLLLSFFK